jgi:hypothetical protein
MRYDLPASREDRLKNVPLELYKMADAVLGFRPKNKAKNLRPKKRKKASYEGELSAQNERLGFP